MAGKHHSQLHTIGFKSLQGEAQHAFNVIRVGRDDGLGICSMAATAAIMHGWQHHTAIGLGGAQTHTMSGQGVEAHGKVFTMPFKGAQRDVSHRLFHHDVTQHPRQLQFKRTELNALISNNNS
jgi:hypothetical protein